MHMMHTTFFYDQVFVCPCVWRIGEVGGVGWRREERCANDSDNIQKEKQDRQEKTARRRHEEADSKEKSRADVQDKRTEMNTKRKRGTTCMVFEVLCVCVVCSLFRDNAYFFRLAH